MSAPPEPDRVIRAFPTATGQPCRNFREGGHSPRIPGHHEIPVAVHTQSVTSTADDGPGQFPHLTQTGNTTTAHPPLDRGSHDSRIAQRSRQNPRALGHIALRGHIPSSTRRCRGHHLPGSLLVNPLPGHINLLPTGKEG